MLLQLIAASGEAVRGEGVENTLIRCLNEIRTCEILPLQHVYESVSFSYPSPQATEIHHQKSKELLWFTTACRILAVMNSSLCARIAQPLQHRTTTTIVVVSIMCTLLHYYLRTV